jgi:hypothetical protein
LGQGNPADTNVNILFSPDYRDLYIIENIIVCNTTGSAATYSIFLDDDGTTHDATTALFYNVSLAANTSVILEINCYMRDPAGSLAVQSGTSDALNYTINGGVY